LSTFHAHRDRIVDFVKFFKIEYDFVKFFKITKKKKKKNRGVRIYNGSKKEQKIGVQHEDFPGGHPS
jgi:hypothetical protein